MNTRHLVGGVFLAVKNISLLIEEEMLNNISFIAAYHERSVSRHILLLVRESIERFEEQHGKIEGGVSPDANVKPPRKS